MVSQNLGVLSLIPSRFCSTFNQPPEAMFSDSGTYVLMAFRRSIPPVPHVIHQVDVDPVTIRYFALTYPHNLQKHLTASGEFVIEIEEVDRTSTRLVSRRPTKYDLLHEGSSFIRDPDEVSVHLDNFICYPSSLADSDRFLLLGQNDDEMMRLLIAPREGSALEIRSIPLTYNVAKRRLEAEWSKRQALSNEDIEEAGK